MFGSNDDKKPPVQPGQPPVAGNTPAEPAAEKKSMFSWLRKKPQETPAPAVAPQEPVTAPVEVPAQESAPAVVAEAAPVAPAPNEPAASVVTETPVAAVPGNEVAAAVPAEPVPVAEVAPVASSAAVVEPATSAVADEASRPAFSRFRINAGAEPIAPVVLPVEVEVPPAPAEAAVVEQAKPGDNQGGWFARLKEGPVENQRQSRRRHGQPVPRQEGHRRRPARRAGNPPAHRRRRCRGHDGHCAEPDQARGRARNWPTAMRCTRRCSRNSTTCSSRSSSRC